MNAREATLARIRAALGDGVARPAVSRDYRLEGRLDAAATVALFADRVADYCATVHHTNAGGLPALVAAILTSAESASVVVPSGLPPDWLASVAAGVEVRRDDDSLTTKHLAAIDTVVTGCATAIAETGTVVLDAAADQGRRVLTLLPDHHICVVAAERIVATVPEALARVDPTRPLTLVSGPSATSDIELDRVEGVHGPRTLDVVIVTAA